MQELVERLRQIKNEDDFWFGYFANQILTEFDFDYKQESDLLREQINGLAQENDGLQAEIDVLEERNRDYIRWVDELQGEIRDLSEQLNEY